MKKTRELKGMTVLALQEGERLGQVRDLILDPIARQVVAVVLDRRVGGEDQIVATANIRNVGPAVITVEDRSSLVSLSRIPRFQELARVGKPIHGKMVISESGERLGKVDDLEVDVQTFRLVSLVLRSVLGRGQVITTERVRTIGADAVVVSDKEPELAAPVEPPAPLPVVAPAPDAVFEPGPDAEPGACPIPPAAEELVPAAVEEAAPMEPPAEFTPLPEPAAVLAVEPESEPPDAPDLPLEPDAPPPEEGDNAWQRWVRRLKSG